MTERKRMRERERESKMARYHCGYVKPLPHTHSFGIVVAHYTVKAKIASLYSGHETVHQNMKRTCNKR